jgi:DNA-directed RNA polymerase specialized sigma24 family protein
MSNAVLGLPAEAFQMLFTAAEHAATRSGAGIESEDVAQEALVLLLEKYPQVRDPRAAHSLVTAIAVRLTANLRRSRERRRRREVTYCLSYAPSSAAMDPAPNGGLSLSPEERVLVQWLGAGLDVRAIAAKTNACRSSVYNRIQSLRRKLKGSEPRV